ncbi:MAG: hypothetical protein RI998_1249 [Pseudomonadota bacterium]|jgi:hypothetical protein
MFAPMRLALFMLALALSSGWHVHADPLSAEDRLQAIRESLVKRAMEGPTEVRSAAFIDGSGVLREASSFVTGMEVRGIRVMAYGRDLDQVEMNSKPLPAGTCKTPAKLAAWHQMVWEMQYGSNIPVNQQFEAQQVALQLKQEVFKAAQQASQWRVVERAVVNSSYEQLLVGQGDHHIPYVLKITLTPSMAAGMPQVSAYDLRWELLVKSNGERVYVAEQQINIDQPRQVPTSSRPLSPVVVAQIQAALDGFVKGMERTLSCRVPQFDIVKVRSDSVRIAGGATSGLKMGAHMVLTDRQQLPARTLEPKALESLALAEVVSLGPHHAELKLKSAHKFAGNTQWVAIPHTP